MNKMSDKFQIIVSAENNPFMAWQCKLFYYSCVTRLNQTPTFFIHDSGKEWLPEFYDILRAGGIVHPAPDYKLTGQGSIYPPRNTPGTLLQAARTNRKQDGFFFLCDADMLFVRAPKLAETLSADFYAYLNYEDQEVQAAARRLRIAPELIREQKDSIRCGAPHIIPMRDAQPIAETWLESIDAFKPGLWITSMYAFGLAIVKLKMKITLTRMVTVNYNLHTRLCTEMVHYSHHHEAWSKWQYRKDGQHQKVWDPQVRAARNTVLGEILAQIREAKHFYLRLFF